MKWFALLKSNPLWLLLPSVLVAGTVAVAAAGFEPLVFDPSVYANAKAEAASLGTVDAAALESRDEGEQTQGDAVAAETLSDGTWTGFAPCGVGNSDGWKPYYVKAVVTVQNGAIQSISDIGGSSTGNEGQTPLHWDALENQRYLTMAVTEVQPQIERAVAAGKTSTAIDAVSGATYSSTAVYNAYVDAVNKAGGQSAKTPAKAASSSKSTKKSKVSAASKKLGTLADGTWKGCKACGVGNKDGWKPYYVAVTVQVKDGRVSSVPSITGTSAGAPGQKKLAWDPKENQVYLNWAIDGRALAGKRYAGVKEQILKAAEGGKTLQTVDAVSGATYSCDAIAGAYGEALVQSAKAAGSEASTPQTPATKPAEKPASAPQPPAALPEVDVSLPIPDGVYRGHALCRDEVDPTAYAPYYIVVEIEAAGGKIARIRDVYGDAEGLIDGRYRYDASENASYLRSAINGSYFSKGVKLQINAKLEEDKPIRDIDTISGATFSSLSIIDAYGKAVEAAMEAAKAAATLGDAEDDSGKASVSEAPTIPEGALGGDDASSDAEHAAFGLLSGES